ncbi:hypothetical protein LEP1GSC173_2490 [Leptospira interrogans str. HAI1594]|uniref:Uncharacterized protein n=5 Tax=Leptospira interrogans TaxID=173 RepID=M3ICW0_LEPIR|nr:hypothetical protein LEP1GSC007_2405 [Leptospira interrogans serovar Bulgarica str. Mallika]EKO24241.1 hypothetical protein LEP1GSC104_2772 [Leptospira interrogans str. UI 12621]EKO87614.1 hypothetical protein LEP1GSC009_2298 [Leptospira interrogans serovar Grippotyphosa str. Andaman]EKP22959.1 hypothetical protein LEP1GSC117_2830 [Leptospira interrogans serovar Icterohaemorrhagiae str. Verdun LP]EKP73979.1 hypothetical protein LEP1GSC173_2490 [Leptospira interrogans str. HAI1594]EKP87405.1
MRKLENFLKVVVPTFSKSTVKSEFVRVPTFYTRTKNGVSQTNFLHRTFTLNNYQSL